MCAGYQEAKQAGKQLIECRMIASTVRQLCQLTASQERRPTDLLTLGSSFSKNFSN